MIGLRLRTRQGLGEIAYRMNRARLLPDSLSVLMYHAVTAENLRDPQQQSVSVRQFCEQLETLQTLRVRWVSLEEGLRRLNQGPQEKPMVSVVFDDGYVGVHDLALEPLRRHQVPATLFLATGFVGKSAFPKSQTPWGRPLTWPEVEHLAKSGFIIGSHSHTHRVFTRLSAQEIRQELRTSKGWIEDHLKQACRLFAYPYGSPGTFDARTQQILKQEGFTAGCTAVWGRCRTGTPALRLPRMRVSWCDTPHELKKSLAGCYDWYRFWV